jgi:hypothetical protein
MLLFQDMTLGVWFRQGVVKVTGQAIFFVTVFSEKHMEATLKVKHHRLITTLVPFNKNIIHANKNIITQNR